MLEFFHADVKRARSTVLKDVTFSLPRGSLTALVGRNGCGKSTLLSSVTGESRYEGSILLDGHELSTLTARKRAQLAAALPQTLLAPHMTVLDLSRLGRTPYLSPLSRLEDSDEAIAEQALSDVGMDGMKDRYLDEISGGERQKAYLAMILAQQTDLLLLDEPTTYMDLSCAHRFMELLKALTKAKHKTVLVAIHDLNLAIRYADNVAILDNGGLVSFSSVSECLAGTDIEATFDLHRVHAEGNTFFIA